MLFVKHVLRVKGLPIALQALHCQCLVLGELIARLSGRRGEGEAQWLFVSALQRPSASGKYPVHWELKCRRVVIEGRKVVM